MKNNLGDVIWKGFLLVLGIAGGFFAIITGTILLPSLPENVPRLLYAFCVASAGVIIPMITLDIVFTKAEKEKK